MVVTHTGANLAIRLESTGRGQHLDGWRLEGIFGREDDCAPKLSAFVRGIGWSAEDVVPFENIRLSGTGKDERGRRFVEVDEFFH